MTNSQNKAHGTCESVNGIEGIRHDPAGREWDVPAEVFTTIETLLPTGKGAFLELWAPTEAGRAGWTHIVERAA